jgi:hypothetical protein
VSRRPLFTIKLQEALREDPRFQALSPTQRSVIAVAVLKWCNDAGTFWPSRKTWALEAGVPPSTVATTVRKAAHVGILTVTQRWDKLGDRTSNLYAVDALLVGAASAATEEIVAAKRGGSNADGGKSATDLPAAWVIGHMSGLYRFDAFDTWTGRWEDAARSEDSDGWRAVLRSLLVFVGAVCVLLAAPRTPPRRQRRMWWYSRTPWPIPPPPPVSWRKRQDSSLIPRPGGITVG